MPPRRRVLSSTLSSASTAEESGNANANAKEDIKPNVDDNNIQFCSPLERNVGFGCFLISFIAYTVTLQPSLHGGDSGELLSVVCSKGVAHPPGYPLFTMLMEVALTIIPFGSPAWRGNVTSAALGAAAIGIIAACGVKLTQGRRVWAAGGAALIWGFMYHIALYAVAAEVFSLNNFLVSIVCYLIVHLSQLATQKEMDKEFVRYANVGAFFCGLCLTNQHTSVLFVAPAALWVLFTGRRHFFYNLKRFALSQAVHSVCALSLFFFLGLLPYIYLPIISAQNRPFSWGLTHTWEGFIKHVRRAEYGTFSLAVKEDHPNVPLKENFITYFDTLSEGYSYFWFIPVLCSLESFIYSKSDSRSIKLLIASCYWGYLLFFHNLANLDVRSPFYRGVMARFWQQPNILLSLLFVAAIDTGITQFWEKKVSKTVRSLPNLVVSLVLVLAASAQVGNHVINRNESNIRMVELYGRLMLEPLPPNAIVLARGDLAFNAASYLQTCEGVRPDVAIVSLPLLQSTWYAAKTQHFSQFQSPNLRKIWRKDCMLHISHRGPDGPGCYDFEHLILANKNSSLFVAPGSDMIPTYADFYTKYVLHNYGVSHQILTIQDSLDFTANRTRFLDWLRKSRKELPYPSAFQLPKQLGPDRWEYNVTTALDILHVNLASKALLYAIDNNEEVEALDIATDIMNEIQEFVHEDEDENLAYQLYKAQGHASVLFVNKHQSAGHDVLRAHAERAVFYWGKYLRKPMHSSEAEAKEIEGIVQQYRLWIDFIDKQKQQAQAQAQEQSTPTAQKEEEEPAK